jgi:DeoR/GlpR family transcriptional regulator of sugar metabolism
MLTRQRKQLILEVLRREGQVIAKRLSRELGLSEDTIRRDLRELAAEGLLQRVHGGALPTSPAVGNIGLRRGLATEGKTRLAATGARMIEPGQTVIFDGGTSNMELIRQIPTTMRFRAVTHSPTIAAAFEPYDAVDVLMIGGMLYRHSMVTIGALAVEALARIRADLMFLGVTGIHSDEGLTTGDAEEAAVKRALLARSAETVVMATNEKLGAVSPCLIDSVEQVTTLIVEADAPQDQVASLEAKGVVVVRAG